MFKKALVPLDITDLAEGILPYVGQLARGLDMLLAPLSVIDPDAVEMPERMRVRPGPTSLGALQAGGYEITSPSAASREAPAAAAVGVHPHETGGTYASQLFDAAANDVKVLLEEKAKELRATGSDRN